MTLVELSAKMPGSLLLISELTFLWTVVNYALVPDPVQEANRSSADRPTVARLWIVLLAFRSVIAGLVTVVIAGVRPGSLLLGLFLAMGSLLLRSRGDGGCHR